MTGKRGRPPGKKDTTKRAGGRWSETTRDKHGLPAKAPPPGTRDKGQQELFGSFRTEALAGRKTAGGTQNRGRRNASRRRSRAHGMALAPAPASGRNAVVKGAGGRQESSCHKRRARAAPQQGRRVPSTLMARSTGAFKTQHATTTSPVRARAAGASGCIRHRQSRGTGQRGRCVQREEGAAGFGRARDACARGCGGVPISP